MKNKIVYNIFFQGTTLQKIENKVIEKIISIIQNAQYTNCRKDIIEKIEKDKKRVQFLQTINRFKVIRILEKYENIHWFVKKANKNASYYVLSPDEEIVFDISKTEKALLLKTAKQEKNEKAISDFIDNPKNKILILAIFKNSFKDKRGQTITQTKKEFYKLFKVNSPSNIKITKKVTDTIIEKMSLIVFYANEIKMFESQNLVSKYYFACDNLEEYNKITKIESSLKL